jgi:hypothetical protein
MGDVHSNFVDDPEQALEKVKKMIKVIHGIFTR